MERDAAKGVELFGRAAEQGCAQGYNNLAMAYCDGRYLPKDTDKARELYEKAAENGVYEAYHNLGLMYEYGEGVPVDLKKAVEMYKKATENGVQQSLAAILRCVKAYESKRSNEGTDE